MDSGASKNTDIEVLRAVAVSFVLIHHAQSILAGLTPEVNLGGAGVDLFFVISGFVIAKTLLPRLSDAASARARVAETLSFWIRRAFRLLPTAWFWLACILAATLAINFRPPALDFATNVDATLAGVFYYANFRYAETFGVAPYGASLHYWTLSLEEQFYLLLPLVALAAGRRLIWALLAIIAFDQLRAPDLLSNVTRMTGLALGVMIAMFNARPAFAVLRAACARAAPLAALMCVLAAACLVLASDLPALMRFKFGVVGLCGATAVLIASCDHKLITPPGATGRALMWLGSRSYALYVIHLPVFLIAKAIMGGRALHDSAVAIVMVLVLTAVLAEMNYRLIETPLRAVGVRLATRLRAAQPNTPSTLTQPPLSGLR